MTILTTGVLATLALIPSACYLTQVSTEYNIAKSAATNKIEEIGSCDFPQVITRYQHAYFAVADLSAPADQPAPGYISIDNTNPNLLDITIVITWRSRFDLNTAQNFSMKTMRAKDGNQ